ncbi:MAG: FKBP-type peptidyl-prolyl cis-trans isomerase [Deltaproteobacteria bacterium]|nr:FKBP-type peptidyl-prolyl cis-trans isomerase [Deltaproteobacteria bacterium]
MKTKIVISLITALAFTGTACNKCPDQETKKDADKTAEVSITKESLKNIQDKLNYAVAFDMGKSLTRNGLEYNKDIFNKGLLDGMSDSDEAALLDDKARMDAKREHAQVQREKERVKSEKEGKENQVAADKFLAENKSKDGVKTTESGLQYIVITEGKGPKPTAEETVKVHYKGTLLDGTEFDSSYKRNQPATFPVGRVVKGWTEALQLMTVGSKWKIFLPPALGYGPRGAGGKIGPNSALIFEIELLEIVKDAAKPGAPVVANPQAIKAAPVAAAPKAAVKPAPAAPAPKTEVK